MAKRTRRKSSRPPPARAGGSRGSESGGDRPPRAGSPTLLQYKVVELSTVDEGSLEETVNAHVGQGWSFDGVHFAMRESSKRPSMAFVFFTRAAQQQGEHDVSAARERLRRIAGGASGSAPESAGLERSADPWTRLKELAEGGEEPS